MNQGKIKYGSILIKGSLAVSLSSAGINILNILLLPVFTFYLTPADYGIASIVSLIMTVMALLYNPGIMSAMIRLYHSTDNEEERKLLLGSAFKFFIFIPIIPILIGLIWGEALFSLIFTDFKFYPYGFLALVLAFFTQPTRVWSSLLTLQYKIYLTALFNTISVIAGLLTTLILVVGFKMGAMGKILGMFPGTLFLFIVSLLVLKKYTKGLWSFKSMKQQLLFGLPIILAIWSYTALDIVGRYMLERMTDLHNVGLYSFGLAVAGIPMFLVLGIKELWGPVFYENMNKKDYKTISALVTYFIGGLTILSLMVLLFSKEVVLIFVNERYYSGIPVISFLILGIYFNGLLTISNTVLGYKNKFGMISLFSFIAVVINIGLNFIIIPKLEVLGAGISLSFSYFVFFLLGAYHQKKTLSEIQAKGIALIPIIVIILATFLVFAFNKLFIISNYSSFEIILKLLILFSVIALFFKLRIIRKNEIAYVFSLIFAKIKKKK